MSKKTAPLALAALALALTASIASAQDVARGGQGQAVKQQIYNARAQADRSEWTYGAREPFTAAQKRAFQTPTGQEVDRW